MFFLLNFYFPCFKTINVHWLGFISLKGLNLETVAMQQYAIMSDTGLLKNVFVVHKFWLFSQRKDPRNCGPINAFF